MGTEPQPEGTTQGAVTTEDVGAQLPGAMTDTTEPVVEGGSQNAPSDEAPGETLIDVSDEAPAEQPPAEAPVPEPDSTEPPPEAELVSLADDPEAEAVSAPATEAKEATKATETEPAKPAIEAKPERVLVSPSDPVLGEKVARWLEREAARDARLGPLLERIHMLPNVYLAFATDDPILMVPVEEQASPAGGADEKSAPEPTPVTAEAPVG
jgi:hypothetical protein